MPWSFPHPFPLLPTCVSLPLFFFNDTATTEIYTLSLHDALPIYPTRQFLTESLVDGERSQSKSFSSCARIGRIFSSTKDRKSGSAGMPRPISYAVFCLKKKRIVHQEASPRLACKERLEPQLLLLG